jgi:FkbM family methyltransferase
MYSLGQSMPNRFYGQGGEDMLAWEVFKNSSSGFFLDVGAYDGINHSNTLFFEQQGWQGICFEPNPDAFSKLKQNRRCILLNRIVGECVSKSATLELSRMCTKRSNNPGQFGCPMLTLNYVLELLGITSVDYVSIDVEGWEREVLYGFDILKYHPRLVIVEDNFSYKELYDYFDKAKYILSRRTPMNIFYLREQSDVSIISTMQTNMENGRLKNEPIRDYQIGE